MLNKFVKPASDETIDWVGISRIPSDEWRCKHKRDNGRLCNRLLAIGRDDFIYSRRGDHHVKVVDSGGSAVGIRCTECDRWNWIFSDGLSEDAIKEIQQKILDQSFAC